WEWWRETSQAIRPARGSWAEGKVDDQPGTRIEAGQFEHKLRTLDRVLRFRVQADGYLPEISQSLDAAALPDEPVRLEFRLRKTTGIVGKIQTPSGDPASG